SQQAFVPLYVKCWKDLKTNISLREEIDTKFFSFYLTTLADEIHNGTDDLSFWIRDWRDR
ncbi:MAG TPA: hypothetical protein DDX29_10035, partial [Clostridiales bacterium]|nr:hypothetical protein [Clostridiales bacterium]